MADLPLVIYVSHPRNGGTKLATEVAEMLAKALQATVYFPKSTDAYGILVPSDIVAISNADVIMVVLNRKAATQVVPRHIVQLELREIASLDHAPQLVVVRAEPCALPEGAQHATLVLGATEGKSLEELVSTIVESLIGKLRPTQENGVPGPLRDYLEHVRDDHIAWSTRYTQLRGRISDRNYVRAPLVGDSAAAADLDALLRSVSLPLAAQLDPLWARSESPSRRVQDIREILYANRRLALIGEPGSGKTTTLRSLAADLAVKGLAMDGTPPVPVLIRLSDLGDDSLEVAIAKRLLPASLDDIGTRGLWLMLDGLNEVPKDRAKRVLDQLRNILDARLIISCRRAEYEGFHSDLPVAEILPLSVTEIPGFLERWGLQVGDSEDLFWTLAGEETFRIWRKWQGAGETFERFWTLESARESSAFRTTDNFDDQAYDSMRRRMREENRLPGLLDVVRNPFLLTLTVAIYNRMHELPSRKGELFHAFVQGLLQRQKSVQDFDIDETHQVLKFVARAMNSRGTTSIELATLETTDEIPEDILHRALSNAHDASVIQISTTRLYFAHQLIQDYFAAYVLADFLSESQPATLLWPDERRKWWSPSIWDEAAVILTGLLGYDSRLKTIANTPWDVITWLTPINPILAWRCVEENGLDIDHPRAEILRRPTPGVRAAPRARLLLPRGEVSSLQTAISGIGVTPEGIPNIEWIGIDAGEFIYGSETVLYLERYWIARYPITNAQFDAFCRSELFADPRVWGDGVSRRLGIQKAAFDGARNPRDRINWYEACAFARWMDVLLRGSGDSRLTKSDYRVRLPLDCEWEKAARGADGRIYPWGNEFDLTRCNTLETGLGRTCPVGIFPDGASPYGVEDMSGNIWEWCFDSYAVSDGTKAGRVNRGGSCFRGQSQAALTYRHDCLPGYHSSGRGFRLVIGSAISDE